MTEKYRNPDWPFYAVLVGLIIGGQIVVDIMAVLAFLGR